MQEWVDYFWSGGSGDSDEPVVKKVEKIFRKKPAVEKSDHDYVGLFWQKEQELANYGATLWEEGITLFYKGIILATVLFFVFLFFIVKRTQRRRKLEQDGGRAKADTETHTEATSSSVEPRKKIILIQPRQEMEDGTGNQTVFVQHLRRGLVAEDASPSDSGNAESYTSKRHVTHSFITSGGSAAKSEPPPAFGTDYSEVPTGKVIQPQSQLRMTHTVSGQEQSSAHESRYQDQHQHANTPESAYRQFTEHNETKSTHVHMKPEARYGVPAPPPPPPAQTETFYPTQGYRAHHDEDHEKSREVREVYTRRTTRHDEPNRGSVIRPSYNEPDYASAIASVEAAATLVEEAIAHQPLRNRKAAFAEHQPKHVPHHVVIDTHNYQSPEHMHIVHKPMTASHHDPQKHRSPKRGYENREYRREHKSKHTSHKESHRDYIRNERHHSAERHTNQAVVHEPEPYRPPSNPIPVRTSHEVTSNYNRSLERSSRIPTSDRRAFETTTTTQQYTNQNGSLGDPAERGLARMIVGTAIQKKREVERPAFRSMYNNPVDDERFKRAITDIRYASRRLDEPMSRSDY